MSVLKDVTVLLLTLHDQALRKRGKIHSVHKPVIQATIMSTSEMNLSWSTPSAQQSQASLDSNVFLTQKGIVTRKKPKCLSAKNSGMRFPAWKEPKPLRSSRVSSAEPQPALESPVPKSVRRRKRESADEPDMKDIISRLSMPTFASKGKSSKTRSRDVGVDMNWYSWSKMNVYKDYQAVLYSKEGSMKKTVRSKER